MTAEYSAAINKEARIIAIVSRFFILVNLIIVVN